MHTNPTFGLNFLQPTDLDAGHVFSGKPSGTTVRGYATPLACTRPLTITIFSTSPAVIS